MLRPAALVLLLLAAGPAFSQPASGSAPGYADLIANVPGREGTPLDGAWQVLVDPYAEGRENRRRSAYEVGPTDLSRPEEFLFDGTETLQVPGDWNTQREALTYYDGTVWYRRDFDRALAPGRRLFVHFGAANYAANVWLNGEWVGAHEGGFTPFQFEITDRVRASGGETNALVVSVENRRLPERVPAEKTDWWNYGGLTRAVTLVETPALFVRDYQVALDPADPSRVRVWVQLDGPGAAGERVRVAVPEGGVGGEAIADGAGRAVVTFPADGLERWSTERPQLYAVEVSGGGDRVEERIGFRTVEARGSEILLNGEPVFLRGVSVHEEAPLRAGRPTTDADARTLLLWARDLGANFVRLAHYPHSEATVRLADEMGMLVWSEVPVYWDMQWENPASYASAERQLREMVTRDKNRASVVLWSVGNETPLDEPDASDGPRLRFMRGLVGAVRALDDTRLVTAALDERYVDEAELTLTIDDPLGADLDVIGCNQYLGWYDGTPAKADSVSWTMAYDKPLVFSEFGGGALQGLHGDPDERWTEEYQAAIYRHQTAMMDRIPFLAGASPWLLVDFRSPRRMLPRIQDGWNRKGLLSERGVRKEAFGVLRDYYLRKAAETAPAASGG